MVQEVADLRLRPTRQPLSGVPGTLPDNTATVISSPSGDLVQSMEANDLAFRARIQARARSARTIRVTHVVLITFYAKRSILV